MKRLLSKDWRPVFDMFTPAHVFCVQVVQQVLHVLRTLGRALGDVLPPAVLTRFMGAIIDVAAAQAVGASL